MKCLQRKRQEKLIFILNIPYLKYMYKYTLVLFEFKGRNTKHRCCFRKMYSPPSRRKIAKIAIAFVPRFEGEYMYAI